MQFEGLYLLANYYFLKDEFDKAGRFCGKFAEAKKRFLRNRVGGLGIEELTALVDWKRMADI